MRRDHRCDDEIADQSLDGGAIEPGPFEMVEGGGQAAQLRLRSTLPVEAATALVVDVLGGVGEQRQPAERPDQMQLLVDRSVGEGVGQRVEGAASAAPGVDGAPAHGFDEFEDLVSGLFADDVAEDPAEQPDVGAQGGILAEVGGGWGG